MEREITIHAMVQVLRSFNDEDLHAAWRLVMELGHSKIRRRKSRTFIGIHRPRPLGVSHEP